ncbi:MAG: glycoside hydrolase [Candidatus Dormibacteraeota bacterium]|nr:glycoside hydrolase [Candidatus Dormibacteraeota bacterium]
MVHRRVLTVLAIGAVLGGASAIGGAAGPAEKPLTGQEIAQKILAKGYRLTAPVKVGLEMIARGDRQLSSAGTLDSNDQGARARTKESKGGDQEGENGLRNVLVNNPGEDSHQTDQTTQSETTVAVHGQNVVVGFNDSQTGLLFLTAGADLSGYAYSTNGGQSFTDGGQLPNRPGEMNLGDPWLGSDRAGNFYYANLVINIDPFTGFNFDVGVAKSTDGGKTFSSPVKADTQPEAASFYSADKDALAVGRDPSVASRDNVYVAWDDFLFDRTTFTAKNGLPVAHSYDGGKTYQVVYANQLVQPTNCSFSQYIGANPIVDPRNGTLYVATEKIVGNNPTCMFPPPPVAFSEVIFKSTDGGLTFGPETPISNVTSSSPTGLFKLGEHQYMRNLEFPSLAVDSSGSVYATWNDGRSGNSHVLISKSPDGMTWGPPTAVTTGANDEMQPALSADGSGLHDLYYKRNANNTLDVVVANSTNGGLTWSYKRVTSRSFPGVFTFPQFDPIIAPAYMGDYIANVSDGTSQYFAWGDNRNTVTNFLWPQGRHDPDVFFARHGQNDQGGDD